MSDRPASPLAADPALRQRPDRTMDSPTAPGAAAEETELPGGGLRIARHEGEHGGEASAGRQREAARIISMAWGDRYIEDVLSVTLPALLAPGNIPAFCEHFDSEFVLVTEARFFDRVLAAPAIAEVLRHCALRLLPIDDLLSPSYGVTLTYALVRGFADLGAAMVDAHLVFCCADFIVADGSYRKLAEMILRGERLVVSPSYCMALETTIGTLRERYSAADCSIAMSHREMAALILANRHNTVRAKTANQQMFRIQRYDQFYWHVDDATLLARQLPIAVIYMRPERVLMEMPTFWDYGVISEYCPRATPCVLDDSDDFLMAELRSEGTARELLHLGWPTVEEIVADLSSYSTQEHHDYGRHTLVLHSRDLPASLDAAKAAFAAFVDGIYRRLSPPISHRRHPFWTTAFPRFEAMRTRQRQQMAAQEEARRDIRRQAAGTDRQSRLAALRHERRALGGDLRRREAALATGHGDLEARIAERARAYQAERSGLEAELRRRQTAEAAALRPLRDELARIDAALAALIAEEAREIELRRDAVAPRVDGAATGEPRPTAQHGVARLVQAYHAMFGTLPQTTRWHPYYALLRHVNAAIAGAGPGRNALVIASGGTFGSLLLRGVAGNKVTITPTMAIDGLYGDLLGDGAKFDLCVCDLAIDDLLRFRDMLEKLRPQLSDRAKIVVFHPNMSLAPLDPWTYEFTRKLFPLTGTATIAFTGSWAGSVAMRWFNHALSANSLGRVKGQLLVAATLALCAPVARFAQWLERRHRRHVLPKHCTSMTIEIELG